MPEQQVEVKKERSWRMKGAGEGGSTATFMERRPQLGRRGGSQCWSPTSSDAHREPPVF